jgi:hypothetical protein
MPIPLALLLQLAAGVPSLIKGIGGTSQSDSTNWWNPAEWTIFRRQCWGFVKLDIDGGNLTSVLIDRDGVRYDSTVICSHVGVAVRTADMKRKSVDPTQWLLAVLLAVNVGRGGKIGALTSGGLGFMLRS